MEPRDGHRLYDTDGTAYLDFANGIAVSALGHAHPRVTAAIHAQVDRWIGPINAIGFTEPISRLATDLAATFPAPLDSVMFLNSGSEAIDGALKLARRVTGRPGIVAFRGGFHGRTFGATSVTTSNLNYRTGYEPLVPGVYFAPYPAVYADFDGDEDRAVESCLAILDSLFATVIAPSMVGALLIEPVQGEGGFIPAPAAFLEGLRERCDRHGSCSSPTRSRPATAGPAGCGRSSTRRSCRTSSSSPRRSPTASRSRPSCRRASSRSAGAAARTARRTAATRWRARPGSRCSRRSATRVWWRTRWSAARS